MGALPILTRDERNVTVFVQDERPDGTVVILRCTTVGEREAGIAVTPQKPKVWPMFLALKADGTRLDELLVPDFQLILDTSKLPAGHLEFGLESFVRQVEANLKDGTEIVHLDLEDASQWGLQIREASN